MILRRVHSNHLEGTRKSTKGTGRPERLLESVCDLGPALGAVNHSSLAPVDLIGQTEPELVADDRLSIACFAVMAGNSAGCPDVEGAGVALWRKRIMGAIYATIDDINNKGRARKGRSSSEEPPGFSIGENAIVMVVDGTFAAETPMELGALRVVCEPCRLQKAAYDCTSDNYTTDARVFEMTRPAPGRLGDGDKKALCKRASEAFDEAQRGAERIAMATPCPRQWNMWCPYKNVPFRLHWGLSLALYTSSGGWRVGGIAQLEVPCSPESSKIPRARLPADPPPPDVGGGTPTPPDNGGGTPTPPDNGDSTPRLPGPAPSSVQLGSGQAASDGMDRWGGMQPVTKVQGELRDPVNGGMHDGDAR